MWPSLTDGQTIIAERVSEPIDPGEVVVASPSGIPEIFRIVRKGKGDTVLLTGDADPGDPIRVSRKDLLARVAFPSVRFGRARRVARRFRLDLREALRGEPDREGSEPAASVRAKYHTQAPYYAARGPEVMPALLERIRRHFPSTGRILVAGSGIGTECLALSREGRQVRGVDFSAGMVERAREAAKEEGLDIEYVQADLRAHRETPGSLAGVLFTYEVYSFIPGARERVALLERMARWIVPGGAVLVSARRVTRAYERLILTLQWSGHRRDPGRAWGDTHTRYIGPDGSLRRSYVHAFTDARVRREARRAGYRIGDWKGGHAIWKPRRST
jgi:SAM-dependent methyltransferase